MPIEGYSASESWYWARVIIVMRVVRIVEIAVCIGSVWTLRSRCLKIISMRTRNGKTGCELSWSLSVRWWERKLTRRWGWRFGTRSSSSTIYLLSNGKQVKVMAVNHPSVGYSWDYWYKVIQRFLRNRWSLWLLLNLLIREHLVWKLWTAILDITYESAQICLSIYKIGSIWADWWQKMTNFEPISYIQAFVDGNKRTQELQVMLS